MSPIFGTEVPVPGLWQRIGDVELIAPAGLVSFAVPAGYGVLWLIWHDVYGDNVAVQIMECTFNGDVGNNYDMMMTAYGAAPATANAQASFRIGFCGETAAGQRHDSGEIVILNRATHEKVVKGHHLRVNKAGANIEDIYPEYIVAKWRNILAEINTITITPSVGNFVAGSRFILLGIPT